MDKGPYRSKIKQTPAQAFKICPQCESKRVFTFDNDAFCESCDWNSVELYAQCREFTFSDFNHAGFKTKDSLITAEDAQPEEQAVEVA